MTSSFSTSLMCRNPSGYASFRASDDLDRPGHRCKVDSALVVDLCPRHAADRGDLRLGTGETASVLPPPLLIETDSRPPSSTKQPRPPHGTDRRARAGSA